VDDTHPDYHFMRDQYLELLWTAQRIEDRRLTELILKRLKDTALEMTVTPVPACEIIPFPGIIVHSDGGADGYDLGAGRLSPGGANRYLGEDRENRPMWAAHSGKGVCATILLPSGRWPHSSLPANHLQPEQRRAMQ
jgi:hypothetical protein